MMKRQIALIVVLCMVLSCIPMRVLGEELEEQQVTEIVEETEALLTDEDAPEEMQTVEDVTEPAAEETAPIEPQTQFSDDALQMDARILSGYYGSIRWRIEDGILSLSGSGQMQDQTSPAGYPWYAHKDSFYILELDVSYVGDYAFSGYDLYDVYCESSITAIGNEAFSDVQYCYFTFYGNAPTFADDTFLNADATILYPLDNPTWSDDVRKNYGGTLVWRIAAGTYQGNSWSILSDGYMAISGPEMTGAASAADYPWYAYKDMVSSVFINTPRIGAHAFENYTNINSVNIASRVSDIGDYAFAGCVSMRLSSNSMGVNVTSIGSKAFMNCTSMQTILFQGGAPTIAADAFTGVTADVHVSQADSWPESMQQNYGGQLTWHVLYEGTYGEIYWSYSNGELALTDINSTEMVNQTDASGYPWYQFKDRIETIAVLYANIGNYCFDGYPNLKALILIDVPNIGTNAFRNCTQLREIAIENVTVPKYANDAFKGVNAVVYYAGDALSTVVGKSYGGNLEWINVELNGLNCVNGVWGYYKDGKIDTSFTDLVYYNGIYYYVENGLINWDYVGLAQHKETEVWYYVQGGGVDRSFTGLTMYNGRWFYLEAGSITWNYTGLVEFEGNWYYVQYSQLNFDYTGLVFHYDNWYYVQNSMLIWDQYTLVNHGGTWYYVQNSTLAWGYYGLVNYNGVWYYLENSQITWNFTDLVLYNDVWYYVKDSTIAWDYTGVVPFNGGMYYVENGTINWGYYGSFTQDGVTYTIENGTVVA